MTSVTQKIPNYIQGMSEQPDELKLQGQTTDLLNCVPDIVNQVVKRPGSRFVQNVDSEIDAEWFNYYRDEQEQYIGCIKQDGTVRIWDALNGNEETVTQTQATKDYFATTAEGATSRGLEDLQTYTINDFTFVTNRNVFPRMTDDKTPVLENQGYAEVKVLAYGREYKFTIIIGESLEIPITYTTPANPGQDAISVDEILTAWETQLNEVGFDTIICGNGIYFTPNADKVFNGLELTAAGEGYEVANNVSTEWIDGITPQAGPNINITAVDGTGGITAFTWDGSQEVPPLGTVLTVDQSQTTDATLTVVNVGTGVDTTFNVSTIDSQTMNVFTDNISDFSRLPSQNKNGYRLKVSNTSDAEEDDFWVQFETNDGEKGEGVWSEILQPDALTTIDSATMPHQIQRTGIGTFEVSTVDYGKREAGVVGYIDETIDGVTYTIEDSARTTNPLPSWINQFPPALNIGSNRKPISKILLFRNRLVFLSNENVSLSQSGEFFSFFADSTIVLSAQDPIDVAAASQKPALLYDGIEQNNGLVLFGATQQYLLSSDDSTAGLTQDTVRLGTIGYYLYDKDVRPVNMGITVGFSNTGGRSFRFFEMADITIDGEPQVVEISKTVSQLLPNQLTQIADSQEGSQLFFSNADPGRENEVWGFRYYNSNQRRLQAAWHRWILPGNVIYHCIMRDTYFAVVRYPDNQNRILEFDIKISDETKFYGDFRIHLDNMVDLAGSDVVQGGIVGQTPGARTQAVFLIPESEGEDVIVELPDLPTVAYKASIGQFKKVTYVEFNGNIWGVIDDVTQEYVGEPLVIGYTFDMQIKIPKFYVVARNQTSDTIIKSDTRASLIIHRFTLDAGATGTFDCTIKRLGYADYVETFEANTMDTYKSNTPNLADQITRNISCYCRNVNLDIILSSQHPSPFTLYSIAWEGDYTNKFYKSV